MKRYYVRNALGTYTEVSEVEFNVTLSSVLTLPDCLDLFNYGDWLDEKTYAKIYVYESLPFEAAESHIEPIGHVTSSDNFGQMK